MVNTLFKSIGSTDQMQQRVQSAWGTSTVTCEENAIKTYKWKELFLKTSEKCKKI